jgi:hypothetical protein
MVDAELGLEPVDGPAFGQRHHAGVVDQQVDPVVPIEDGLGGGLDRGERPEVQFDDFHGRRRVRGEDLGLRGFGLVLIACGHHDVRALGGQRSGDGEPDAAVGAAHDREAALLGGNVGSSPAHECSL